MSTLLTNPYILLSVSRNVTEESLKKRYRELMLKYHPDKAGADSHAKCQEIIAAYEKISE